MARTCVFWPGISKEMIEKCLVCAKFQIGNAPEPEMPHEFPTSPWVKVAIDFFYFNGRNFIIWWLFKFIEMQLISNLQATVVIPAIKSIFARHGIPLELISDGGPPFNFRDFDCFAKSWKFKHVKVSAKYPKSNGQVERTIQTVKQIFRKTSAVSKDPYLALLLYRATPVLGSIYSQAELLMNLKLSIVLPSSLIHKGVQNESYYNYQNNFTDSADYSTSDAIPESTPTVRPQEPTDEPESDSQSSQESSSYEPISRSRDKGPYRTR
ncbi:hypothetical protein AVEN_270898-1 [Araneus ventricosus]|uniref:Integrase catalytic domain-containing protein n=1 Tax=Araneus ventricosus TaxID=182803 RepID=A0A4Y2T3B7_ARAVE|nr:hypothetical protein AVEN_270898-1 [Araneus ventricosus]